MTPAALDSRARSEGWGGKQNKGDETDTEKVDSTGADTADANTTCAVKRSGTTRLSFY